jgi:hypothetical protein
MINPTYTIAASFSWAPGQITITNQTSTGFTINWHDRARRSAVRHSSWTRTSEQNARP